MTGKADKSVKIVRILIHTSVKLVTVKGRPLPAACKILIHTSVKLVTSRRAGNVGRKPILIHTSVKLVTEQIIRLFSGAKILIHTSVKLVTRRHRNQRRASINFNPHEREARDSSLCSSHKKLIILIHTSVKLVTNLLLSLANGPQF